MPDLRKKKGVDKFTEGIQHKPSKPQSFTADQRAFSSFQLPFFTEGAPIFCV